MKLKNKISDIYIQTNIIKPLVLEIRVFDDIVINKEYEERIIIKELIPKDKNMAYVWGNIGNALMLDYKCMTNSNIMKLKDYCFNIEKSIKRGDFDIVTLDIKNVLLPFLDKLTNDEIDIIYKANRVAAGPLYNYQPYMSTPQIFIDLFTLYQNKIS